MDSIAISVIVPAYNTEKYIEKCIVSIIHSTLKNIEIIAVDDASTDCTLEKLKKIKDPRLTIISSEDRGGVSKARNRGIEIATGKYIAFVDSDDWIAPTMFSMLYVAAEKNDSDITVCNHYSVYPGKQINAGDVGKNLIFTGQQVDQYINMFMLKRKKQFQPYFPIGQPWGTLFRKQIIDNNNIRFIEGMQYKEDVIFNLYAAQYSTTIVRINEPLYYYNRSNVSSLTSSGLKKGMLPRIEMDIKERYTFYNTYKGHDELFKKGLLLYTCRTFFRNVVPACILDSNYQQCKIIFKNNVYSKAFDEADKSCFNKMDRVISTIISNNGLWLYYHVIWLFLYLKKVIERIF